MPSGVYKRKPLTEEHKKNIGDGLRGLHSGMLGKKHSLETRKKASDILNTLKELK